MKSPLNLFYFISTLTPLFFTFFLVFLSAMNQDWKVFFYILGLGISAFATFSLANKYTTEIHPNRSYTCDVFNSMLPFNIPGERPNFDIVSMFYTILYVFIMPASNVEEWPNLYLFTVFTVLSITNIFLNWKNKCSSNLHGILLSALLGIFLGGGWFLVILWTTNSANTLYFTESSGKEVCSRPTNNTFKFKVYKNGHVIGTM